MANVKKLSTTKVATDKTVYCIIRREADGYLMNAADGTFVVAPANSRLYLTEDATIDGLYEVSESRVAWNDGRYKVFFYSFASVSITPTVASLSAVGIAPTVTV